MSKTDFFVLGFPKCGTTSLYEYLKTHPHIFLPSIKEPHFFCEDIPSFQEIFTLEQYEKMYAGKSEDQIAGDFSIFSLFSKVALQKIITYQPDSKVIVMLRNPVDMFHSFHSQMVYAFYETEKNCELAWDRQEERMNHPETVSFCREPDVLQYKKVCSIGSQLQKLMKSYPSNKLHVVVLDDFKSDTLCEYKKILEFLGINYDGRKHFPIINESKEHRWNWLGRLLIAPSSKLMQERKVKAKIQMGTNYTLSRKLAVKIFKTLVHLNNRYRLKPPISPEFRKKLSIEFRSEVELLEQLLQRNFTQWRN